MSVAFFLQFFEWFNINLTIYHSYFNKQPKYCITKTLTFTHTNVSIRMNMKLRHKFRKRKMKIKMGAAVEVTYHVDKKNKNS
jgi:hypothetical protein